jgi:hydrogenase maturation protease
LSDLLVLGLGNVLCSDDGVGVAAVHRLLGMIEPPEGVEILDGGTLGLSLLPSLEDAKAAILLDAIRTDDPPGTLVRLEGEDVAPAVAARLSVHQVGVADLLDAARLRGKVPPRLVLLGVVPESLELGIALSPRVAEALPTLCMCAMSEAAALGYVLSERRTDALPRRGSGAGADVLFA